MTSNENACSALLPGSPGLCRNGFPQTAACRGNTCFHCHRPTSDVPMCMLDDFKDKVFKVWFSDSGLPRFAKIDVPAHNEIGDGK